MVQPRRAVAAALARPLTLLGRVAHPLVLLLQGSSTLILRPLGFRPISARLAVRSEEELRGILAEAEETGIIEEAEEEMLEEIVGEIADEYDLPDESVKWLGPRTAQIAGTFPLARTSQGNSTSSSQKNRSTPSQG